MKYQLLAAGALLVPLAAAGNAQRCKVSLKTELEVVTVIGSAGSYAPPASTESENTQVSRYVGPTAGETASPSLEVIVITGVTQRLLTTMFSVPHLSMSPRLPLAP